jgi:6-phosphofructo-2-kinase/fructose-2,6-biphosphatase 4
MYVPAGTSLASLTRPPVLTRAATPPLYSQYRGWNAEEAIKDYWSRIRDLEKSYQPIIDPDAAWIKVVNVGERIVINRIEGYLQSRIIFFLMVRRTNSTESRTSASQLTFPAEPHPPSEHSQPAADHLLCPVGPVAHRALVQGRLGPVSCGLVVCRPALLGRPGPAATGGRGASGAGRGGRGARAQRLDERPPAGLPHSMAVCPARLQGNGEASDGRDQRASALLWRCEPHGRVLADRRPLSLAQPGVWDGLSSEEAKEAYPDEWERFLKDPYAHRAPRAESYHDLSGPSFLGEAASSVSQANPLLAVRLESVIFELERCQDDLLIIGHASVIRCLVRNHRLKPPRSFVADEPVGPTCASSPTSSACRRPRSRRSRSRAATSLRSSQPRTASSRELSTSGAGPAGRTARA